MSLGIREIGGGEIMHLFLPIYTPRAPSFFFTEIDYVIPPLLLISAGEVLFKFPESINELISRTCTSNFTNILIFVDEFLGHPPFFPFNSMLNRHHENSVSSFNFSKKILKLFKNFDQLTRYLFYFKKSSWQIP